MRGLQLFLIYFALTTSVLEAQVPSIQWQHSLGGTKTDWGYAACLARDQNVVIIGTSESWDGDLTCHQGGYDIWLLKLNNAGGIIWQQCFGGIGSEEAYSIQLASDGGFIFAGRADANSGIVSGVHGNYDDFWIVKTDSNGIFQWQKCFGGTDSDEANEIHQTRDGGFIVVGSANSDDGDVVGHHGCNGCYNDVWLIKLDSVGNLQWQKPYGGTFYDWGASVKQTNDDGYIVGAYTGSIDGDVTNNHGFYDAWIIKTDSTGALQWQKCYGGSYEDIATSICQTYDGGYAFVGQAVSTDGDVVASHLGSEVWLVKIDSAGTIQWQKTLGGNSDEWGESIQVTNDHGFFITAYVESNDGDVSGSHGWDIWAVKTDSVGNIQWQKCLGGTDFEDPGSGIQTPDSGYVVIGSSYSNDGDVSGHHFPFQGNEEDMWVVKLGQSGVGVVSANNPINDFITNFSRPLGLLTLNFYANGNERSQVQLLDITGRVLLSLPLEVMAGFNNKQIQIGSITAGIYLVRFLTDGGAVTKKVVVQ